MVLRGEILIGLSIEPTNNDYEIDKDKFDDKLNQLLESNSEVESNIYYVIWLFGKIGGDRVMKGTILE